MKLLDILAAVGSAGIQVMLPGVGNKIVSEINRFLPSESKLPFDSTGVDVENALSKLPAEQQASIKNKEYDVAIVQIQEQASVLRNMLNADAANPHSTRPYIAKHCFHTLALLSVLIVLAWFYGVVTGKDEVIKVVVNGWPFVASIIAPFVLLLRAYFGILKDESKHRMDAAVGVQSKPGLSSLLANKLSGYKIK